MNTYLDLGSGVAGDMLIGALVDLGLPARRLETMLRQVLHEPRLRLVFKEVHRRNWPAHMLTVVGDRPFGSGDKMIRLIRSAKLPEPVKKHSISILRRLMEAEFHAHGTKGAFDQDGIGLLDTLVDILGTSYGFHHLSISELTASPLHVGRVAPATAWMLKTGAVPVFAEDARHELATPTGVAILLEWVKSFGPMRFATIHRTGYGAGHLDRQERPNVLVIHQGEDVLAHPHADSDAVVVLETVIDDMDPRVVPYAMERLLALGALDTWWTSVGMKKGRPGIAMTTLVPIEKEQAAIDILFRETTTLGIRRHYVQRWILPRSQEKNGKRKTAVLPGGSHKSQIEFEPARALAERDAIPLRKLLK